MAEITLAVFNVLLRKQIRLYNTGQKVKTATITKHIICEKYISLQMQIIKLLFSFGAVLPTIISGTFLIIICICEDF